MITFFKRKYPIGKYVFLKKLPKGAIPGSNLNVCKWPIPCVVEIIKNEDKDGDYYVKLVNAWGSSSFSVVDAESLTTKLEIK